MNSRRRCWIVLLSCVTTLSFATPPTVVSVSPSAQSLIADRQTQIVVTFDVPVDSGSIVGGSMMIFGRWSGVAPGQYSFEQNATRVRFVPSRDFSAGEWVVVSLSRGVRSQSGDSLARAYTWHFWIRSGPGTLDLMEHSRISTRRQGEGHIQTYGAYAGDLNRDGYSDFTIPNEISHDVRVLMNDGHGNYGTFVVYPIPGGSYPSTNEGVDLNGNGFIDFAVGNSQNDTVSVFMNDGQGGFLAVRNYHAASGIRGLSIADLEGDGDMDIVTANRAANNVTMLYNTGDGTFSSPTILEANGSGETACAVADANGDGIVDLFVGSHTSNEMSLLLGNGTGGFTFSTKVPTGTGPWMVAVGDVNGDGNVDVVSANASASTASVILGNGLGGLLPAVSYPVGAFPLAIDLGDLDGDGDLDMVTSNYSGGSWTVYENNGSGVFANPRTLPSSSAGSCATLHDRDNDGDLDITGIDEVDDLIILFDNDAPVAVREEVPVSTVLLQNYPNPFNPATTIQFTVPVASHVSLTITDILGRNLVELVNERMQSGTYRRLFDASSLASGLYVCKFSADRFAATKKLLLLK